MIHNGGEVFGMTTTEDRKSYPKEIRHKLLQHRSKHFHFLVDRLTIINSDLREVLRYVRDNVSERWYKSIKGRISGLMLIRYMEYLMYPQQYAYRGDLIFYANYSIVKSYLQRLAKVLILNYELPNRYYGFKVPTEDLYRQSILWTDEMLPTAEKMVKHLHSLTS